MQDNQILKFSWIKNPKAVGERLFTFGDGKIFNLFRDYPHELTPEQKQVFDEANPYWANFFRNRKYER